MELNDMVTVRLTAEGAKILNDRNIEMQQQCPALNLGISYKDGDHYKAPLWCLFEEFGNSSHHGCNVVFTNLELLK